MINYNCASHPHNIYLQWLAEGGLIIFSFLIYLFYLSKRIIKNKVIMNINLFLLLQL